MTSNPRTLATAIAEFARQTGAGPDFIAQVERLFTSKGIALDSDAAAYEDILSQTFERQAKIDRSDTAYRQAEKLQTDLRRLGRIGTEQIARLQELASGSRELARRVEVNNGRIKRFRYYLSEFYTPLDP